MDDLPRMGRFMFFLIRHLHDATIVLDDLVPHRLTKVIDYHIFNSMGVVHRGRVCLSLVDYNSQYISTLFEIT
jgi:hypothetical protein